MKQIASVYLILIFAAVLTTQSAAKRGCSMYGHSCYGGHGKRSEIVEVFPRSDSTYKQVLDEVTPEDTRDYEVHPRFKLMKMIRQWLEEGRPLQKNGDTSNISNELFKDSFGNTI